MKTSSTPTAARKTGFILNSGVPSSGRGAGKKTQTAFSLSGTAVRDRDGESETSRPPRRCSAWRANPRLERPRGWQSWQGGVLGQECLLERSGAYYCSFRQKSFSVQENIFQQHSVLNPRRGTCKPDRGALKPDRSERKPRVRKAQARKWRTSAARVMLGGAGRLASQNCGGQRRLVLLLRGQFFRWCFSWLQPEFLLQQVVCGTKISIHTDE